MLFEVEVYWEMGQDNETVGLPCDILFGIPSASKVSNILKCVSNHDGSRMGVNGYL